MSSSHLGIGAAPVSSVHSDHFSRTGLKFAIAGSVAMAALLAPPTDAIADSDLTVHMFQHISLFVAGMVTGYGLEILIMRNLGTLKRWTPAGWRLFTWVMRVNSRTKGFVFVVGVPALVFAYWHLPQNFDLAVQNESAHSIEHLGYLVSGSLAGLSVRAIPRRWKVILLYLAFMQAGMMGSMWTVWRPGYFPLYSYAANLEMGTALMLFGGAGVVGTSSLLLRAMDII